jgi:N-acetylneuraminate synthase
MTLDHDGEGFTIDNPVSLWNGEKLYDLYARASTPWEWHEAIFARCRARGLIAFSTPFDASAVDFLESLNVPCYKISSFECTDIPLITRVAQTGKPLIISTGMATEAEIRDVLQACQQAGCRDIILLKCTSTYPARPDDINLRAIPRMRETFGCHIGLSDHTLGIGVAVAAVAQGAVLVEKHFTLSRTGGAVDAAFSMEPADLVQLVRETDQAWRALGVPYIGPVEREMPSLIHRRSLYVVHDLEPGAVVRREDLRAIRPGYGLAPKYLEDIIGRRVIRRVTRGTPAQWDLFESR